MSEEIMNVGAEEQELAEPVEVQEGAEEQELAEPVDTKKDSDTAFAEMRRAKEKAERDLSIANAEKKQMYDALGLYFDGDTAEDKIAQAIANAQGRDVADVKRELAEKSEIESIKAENEALKVELNANKAKEAMAKDLAEIQAIDPSVTTLADLGPTFARLIFNGCDAKTAYFAAKAEQEHNKVVPPKPPGKIGVTEHEKEYFTKEEVQKMSPAEIEKNYDKIRASQMKW